MTQTRRHRLVDRVQAAAPPPGPGCARIAELTAHYAEHPPNLPDAVERAVAAAVARVAGAGREDVLLIMVASVKRDGSTRGQT